MENIKIIVATHKKYRMPEDKMYIPVQAGAACRRDDSGNPITLGYLTDDTGDNISLKNPSFCELTALYWAWKNVDADYLGLVHYRRHFRGGSSGDKFERILSFQEAEKLLAKCPVLLPKKRHYYIESNKSQYIHAHHEEGLSQTENVIKEFYPEYSASFEKVMKRTSGHRFNMFIMRRDYADAYCTWLFDILFKVEKRLDISAWSDKEKRVFGYLAERLLDVWLLKNGIEYKDIPYMFMENINWFSKITSFIIRKFSGPAKND